MVRFLQRATFVLVVNLLWLLPAAACVTNVDVINLDKTQTETINPCNDMVEIYAHSLGIGLERRFMIEKESLQKFPYFFPARRFLTLKQPNLRSEPIVRAGNLAAVFAVADMIPAERRTAYLIFANYHFLRLDVPEMGNLDLFFGLGLANTSLTDPLDTLDKNLCFVEADMPSLSMELILDSTAYSTCLMARAKSKS